MSTIECVYDVKAIVGEGPCWHDNKLYWIDIEGHIVHIHDPKTGTNKEFNVGQRIGTLAPKASGGLLLALHNGIASLDLDTGDVTPICDPEADLPDNRFNDGKCDPAGRFFAGTMPMGDGMGALYLFDHDMSYTRVRSHVKCSNGLAWTSDQKTMYYIDTSTMQVDAYDYDMETSAISNPRGIVIFTEGMGVPDGMTIDVEDMIWVAHWGGWGVSRFNPATGECLQKIELPCAQVTACAFGGDNMDELYITTAKAGLDDDEISNNQPSAGSLFKKKPIPRASPHSPLKSDLTSLALDGHSAALHHRK